MVLKLILVDFYNWKLECLWTLIQQQINFTKWFEIRNLNDLIENSRKDYTLQFVKYSNIFLALMNVI